MKESTQRIYKKSLQLHKLYKGKISIKLKCPVRNLEDFNYWYTPGVAAVSKEIYKNVEKVFEYTNKWNTVAIVSDGSRVLGLGDIGPYAALPVMEGKALIFKYLGGVDAIPLVVNTKNPDEIVNIVKLLSPSFGGVNLEDIEQPKCFYILERLRSELEIPVWHDDQQGTATVTLAGLYNALKLVNKKINEVKVVLIGAGAANVAIAKLLIKAGVNSGNIIVVDSKGILHTDREDIKNEKNKFKEKWYLCVTTNKEKRKGGIEEALVGTDVVISASKPGPGIIKKEWIKKMNKDPVVFALANPIPEILPQEAKQAGARIVATGRSDYPNQINNSLCFPGIFRGVLDVQAKTITDEMCISVAKTLALFAEKKGLNENYIIPTMQDWEVYPEIATAAGVTAIKQNIAAKVVSKKQLYKKAKEIISNCRKEMELLMKEKLIRVSIFAFITFCSFIFGKEITRYKYFVESLCLDGSCGKIYSISSDILEQNKVLLGLHKFDVVINYAATLNSEVGIKFNLNEQQNVMEIDKNITKISPYVKYRVLNCVDSPIGMSLGVYRTTMFVVAEKLLPEFYSVSILLNLMFSYLEKQKFYYNIAVSKYTKWLEFIIDLSLKRQMYSFGIRALLTPDVKLDLFMTDLKNLNNILFYNFVFGISIKI